MQTKQLLNTLLKDKDFSEIPHYMEFAEEITKNLEKICASRQKIAEVITDYNEYYVDRKLEQKEEDFSRVSVSGHFADFQD